MGSKGSKTTPNITQNDDDIDYKNLDDTVDDYPPPYIPERSREHVYDPDVVASIQENIDKMPIGTDANYPSLLKYLCEDLTKDVHRVTAIYLWMKGQDYSDPDLDRESEEDTPRGYMRMIKEGQGSYTHLFTILCRRADIPCMILHGIGKNRRYYIGKPDSKLRTKWTAVFTDDEWRLVHIKWAVKAARDKNQNIKNSPVSDFFFLTDPANFACMCSPDNFRWQLLNHAYTRKEFLNFPYLSPQFFTLNGRLISPNKGTVKTPRNNIDIELSFPRKIIDKMVLEFDFQFIEPLKNQNDNSYIDENSEDLELSLTPCKLAKYVFINRKQTKFVIEIGLPATGKYMFDIFGVVHDDTDKPVKQNDYDSKSEDTNTYEQDNAKQQVNKPGKQETDSKGSNTTSKIEKLDNNKTNTQYTSKKSKKQNTTSQTQDNAKKSVHNNEQSEHQTDDNSDEQEKNKIEIEVEEEDLRERMCQFRFIAEYDPAPGTLEPNPDNPSIGWGPGPRCRELGIVPVNQMDGCIYMRPDEVRDVDFRMTREVDVTCQLVHDSLPVYNLVDKVECIVKRKIVNIRVQIPEEGRYALKIYARDAGKKEFKEACVYLIRQRVQQRFNEKYRDKMLRGRLEHHIKYTTSEEELENALEEYRTFQVPDHGEKERATTKLKQYWQVKKGLNGAVMGRNHHAIQMWLARAKQSQYATDLREDIDKGEHMYDKTVKMKGHLHPISKLDQHTMTEIRSYKHPPKVVQNVMKSTYLLLGEDKQDVEDWGQIQSLMGQTGQNSLQRRVLNRHVEDVDKEVAKEADDIIKDCSLEKCRGTSTGIGAFYKWCKQFTRDVEQQDMDDRDKEEENEDITGRETFRDTPDGNRDTPDTIRDSNRDKEDDHSSRMQEETKSKPRPSMAPMKASSPNQKEPVSYAGFKPYDM